MVGVVQDKIGVGLDGVRMLIAYSTFITLRTYIQLTICRLHSRNMGIQITALEPCNDEKQHLDYTICLIERVDSTGGRGGCGGILKVGVE